MRTGKIRQPLAAGCLSAAMLLRDSSCPVGALPPYGCLYRKAVIHPPPPFAASLVLAANSYFSRCAPGILFF